MRAAPLVGLAPYKEWAYTFVVFERAGPPSPKWEIRRKVRLLQGGEGA